MRIDQPSVFIPGTDSPRLRRTPAPHDETLTWAARAMLRELRDQRPTALLMRYPRILNRIGDLWRSPAEVEAYIRELVFDPRGGRRGFPESVIRDVERIRRRNASRLPSGSDPWDRGSPR